MRKTITLRLDANDVGQVVDGLEARYMVWQRTAEYLQTGYACGEIEECTSPSEATNIAALYRRIIDEIQKQVERQGG
jgi:hypothetical protein